MRIIRVCKAEPLHDQKPVPATIIIDDDLPEFETIIDGEFPECDFKKVEQFYQDEANLLIDALHNALPQGTFDRLGIAFMQKKVSLYRGKTNG